MEMAGGAEERETEGGRCGGSRVEIWPRSLAAAAEERLEQRRVPWRMDPSRGEAEQPDLRCGGWEGRRCSDLVEEMARPAVGGSTRDAAVWILAAGAGGEEVENRSTRRPWGCLLEVSSAMRRFGMRVAPDLAGEGRSGARGGAPLGKKKHQSAGLMAARICEETGTGVEEKMGSVGLGMWGR